VFFRVGQPYCEVKNDTENGETVGRSSVDFL